MSATVAGRPVQMRHPLASMSADPLEQPPRRGLKIRWTRNRVLLLGLAVVLFLAISVLLLRNAFRQIPFELVEAALMDGCSYARIFFSIILPLSRPILSTVAIIAFVASWNNFLLPLVVLNSTKMYPWPLGLMDYQGQYMTSWQLVLAFITMTILPAILVFVLVQRHIVEGLTAGAVRG